MSRPISRGELLIILAFTVPVIVELRTVAGFLGIDLSITQYFALAVVVVGGVLGAIALWNLRAGLEHAGVESSRDV